MNGKIKIRHPLKAYFKVPSYVTFYKFLKKLNLVDFGEKLSAWLQSQEGTLSRRLALDDPVQLGLFGAHTLVRTWRKTEHLARTIALYFFAKSGMSNCQAFKEKMQANPNMAFDLVMRKDA